jgi:16S rRNA (adenine(1408)-N(1))-methyltransferase
LGTGDGRFVLDQARRYPRKLCVGIDASAAAMVEGSRIASKKPARGGVANALFVWANVEALPQELYGLADEITINYPWGSLLRALVEPDLSVLRSIRNLAHPDTLFTILINLSVFEDLEYCQKLRLPPLDLARAKTDLVYPYRDAGIHVKKIQILDKDVPHKTTWGQKLIRGSSRKTLLLEAIVQ